MKTAGNSTTRLLGSLFKSNFPINKITRRKLSWICHQKFPSGLSPKSYREVFKWKVDTLTDRCLLASQREGKIFCFWLTDTFRNYFFHSERWCFQVIRQAYLRKKELSIYVNVKMVQSLDPDWLRMCHLQCTGFKHKSLFLKKNQNTMILCKTEPLIN